MKEYDPLFAGYMISFSRPFTVHLKAHTRITARGGHADALLYDINAYAEENRRVPLDVDAQHRQGSGI